MIAGVVRCVSVEAHRTVVNVACRLTVGTVAYNIIPFSIQQCRAPRHTIVAQADARVVGASLVPKIEERMEF